MFVWPLPQEHVGGIAWASDNWSNINLRRIFLCAIAGIKRILELFWFYNLNELHDDKNNAPKIQKVV